MIGPTYLEVSLIILAMVIVGVTIAIIASVIVGITRKR